MSLNGLDDAKVVEAHEFAAAELGGWFLLKYANRDEVELYERGNGGIVDIRGAIAKYEETSPLYGFLRYRRRNVIIKYQPDDCSRLVQARAAVHFNAVCERFTPCDTTFEISAAKDLKDSKLSAACSLHAASGSASSSSSSLRRRRLNEIAEEEEEEERERKRQSTVKEEERRTSSVYSVHGNPTSSPENVAVLDRQQISSPPRTDFASTTNVPEFTGADRPTSPSKSESAPRLSSQSTRPDLYSYATYAYGKPRVKLGPRPSLDVNKRPATAGNFRPIAALPAGFKFFSKGSKKGHSHDGEHAEKTEEIEQNIPNTTLATTIPIPEIPQNTGHQLPPRPATSSGASMKSITTSLATQPTKETKITPEKARLMKAMKLREKKMMKGQTTASETAPMSERKESNDIESKSSLRIQEDVNQRTVSHADSGIAIDPPTPMTAHTEDTVSDSHPNSPTAATSSEIGVSTKASSLSESTDETVQATKDEGEEAEDTLFRQQSELSELEDPRKSVMETTRVGRSGRTEASQSAMQNTNVSDVRDTGASQEFNGIPASNPRQTTEEPSIRESIEVDDLPELTLQTRVQPTREEDSPKSPWGLPISKFSSNEPTPTSPKSTGPSLKSKFSIPDLSIPDLSIPTEPVPALPTDTTPTFSIEGRELARDESPSRISPDTRLSVQKSAKRKTTVGVIRTDFSKTTPHSEASDPLLDDALMDELQSATVQEARPMLVSKSPITPVFPNTSPLKPAPHLSRTVSNPMRGPLLVPSDVSQSSARSVSAGGAAFLHTITRQSSSAGLQAKKSNLGSSISQRIKALEKLSSTPSTEDLRPKTAAPSSTFFSVRKQSIRDSSKSPSVAERADSLKRTPERSREGTPETPNRNSRERSLSVASRLTMFEGQNAPRGRPESIQVTARIIRDPSQSLPRKAEVNNSPGDYPQLELKQSPLVVDLQRAERAQTMYEPYQAPIELPKDTIQERRDRKSISEESEKKSRRRSSLNMVKDFIKDRRASITSKSTDNLAVMSPTASGAKSPSRPPSTHTNSGGFTHRLSISSRRSSMSRERDSTTSPPVRSPTVLSDSGSDKSNKKMKRASRFIRRLSNSLGAGRKNTSPSISPTVAEEDADQLAAASITNVSVSSSQPAVVAYMGDVNVQFPDNLLWKRRSMCLDTQGYLFLSAIQGTTNGKDKMGLKRYHMSDFRMPYIPDVEIQELPNSVVLDLMEGSSLQIACEDRAGQLNVLHTLQDAHQTHNGQ